MVKKFLLSFLVFAAAATQAQSSLGEMVEQEGLDWIIGSWIGEDQNGGAVTLSYKWELNKHAVTSHVKTEWVESKGMSAMCQQTGEPRYFAVDTNGSTSTGTWGVQAGNPVLRVEYYRSNGESGKGAYLHKKVDADTMEVSAFYGPGAEYLSGTPTMKVNLKRKK